MSSNCGASKPRKSTINYHQLSLDKHQLFEPVVFLTKDHDANHQSKQSIQSASRYTDRRLTTPQLVSTLAGIWNVVGQPKSPGTAQRYVNHDILHNEDHVCLKRDQKGHSLTSCCDESTTGVSSQTCLSTPKSIYEDLSLVKKTLMLKSCLSMVSASSRHIHVTDRLGNTHYLQHWNMYPMQIRSMETYTASSNMNSKKDLCFGRDDNFSSQTRSMPNKLRTSSSEEANITHGRESSPHDTKSNIEAIQEHSNSSAHSFQQMGIDKEARAMPGNQIFSNTREHELEDSTCTSFMEGDAAVVNFENADQYSYGVSQQHFVNKCSSVESSFQHQFDGAVAVNRHAVAGALAGTVVSVSLHPIDTVKTIIQANSSGQSSFHHILRRTLVERGVLGLYGGLASKIACSAPISAIYTLTYEIVKGALLPILPKDYHSIAHCAAGGCSSIATSFVFTPSEFIKQQMQVGSRYQSCWNAFVGCLQRGGIASLYAGWGAVLCRNIPHSIVKFYAYESLKQFLLKSTPDNANLDVGQTLFCGGFAGSTAALFTTPFDVVKTRVQLQALRPVRKYEGVRHALKEIFQQEGLQGLYRGLTPRLAMYISQGAIFFASYEFLKTIMFPEQEFPDRRF